MNIEIIKNLLGESWYNALKRDILGTLPNILTSLRTRENVLPTSLRDVFQPLKSTDPENIKAVVIGEG